MAGLASSISPGYSPSLVPMSSCKTALPREIPAVQANFIPARGCHVRISCPGRHNQGRIERKGVRNAEGVEAHGKELLWDKLILFI